MGNLNACNTIGSIIGTFLPTFVTIPAVGTAITFLIFAGILLLLSLVYFISEKRKKVLCVNAVIIFLLCSLFGNSDSFAFWRNDLRYEGESIYNYLQVSESESSIALSTNVLIGIQSLYMKSDTLTGMYYDYALAAPIIAGYGEKDDFDILILGMGCGTYATQCLKYYPGSVIEGVEIDGKITELAREYFHMPEDIKVTTYDGRAFLQGTAEKYDVIMVDAYQDITIPFQMSSKEFFEQVAAHLKDDGVMVVNLNMRSDKEGNINQYLCDTIGTVFPEIYTVDVGYSGNRELFAFRDPDMMARLERYYAPERDLREQMRTVRSSLKRYDAGNLIFTDDKAPVELLGMRVIDDMITEEVSYYKELFREYGIRKILSDYLGL